MSKNSTMKIVALYARCSTTRDQDPEVQISELRAFCASRGWKVGFELVDHGYSGSNDKRPRFRELMSLVRRRKVDIVVVVKLDRLFRSLKQIVVTLQELDDLRVEFCSVRDQFDLTTASGRLLMHLISSFAEFERSLISERTIAGLVHTRSKGTILGRPKTINEDEIRRLRANGLSFRKIMKEIGCSMGAVNRALGGAPKTCADSHEESQVGTGVSDG